MKYFGTNLNEYGHYLWELGENSLYDRSIDFDELGFNPDALPLIENKHYLINGTTRYFINKGHGYSVLMIVGSCKDQRPGCRSVFIEKGEVSRDKLIEKIKSNPMAMRIINAMPFDVFDLKDKISH